MVELDKLTDAQATKPENTFLIQAMWIAVPAILGILAFIFGLSKSGFDLRTASLETVFNLNYYMFSVSTIAVACVALLIFLGIAALSKEGDSEYGNNLFIHMPGRYPALPFITKNSLKLILGCFVLFGILGFMTVARTNTAFIGVGNLEQQFSTTDQLIFSLLLTPASENLVAQVFASMFCLLLLFFAYRRGLSKISDTVLRYSITIASYILVGYLIHLTRYGNSQIALGSVIVFWGIMGLITALSGSMWPGIIMHLMNNLFVELNRQFASQTAQVVAIAVIVAAAIWLIYLVARDFQNRPRRRK